MSLSVTGSSVFIGQDLVGGEGIEFIPTDMAAVDADGDPTGEKLLIAKTLHTNGAHDRIKAHLLARGETHGSMVMHWDGTAHVVRRGTERDPQKVRRTPVMEPGHDFGTVHSTGHGISFHADGALILAGDDKVTHPAVNITWYESASQAAALEDAHNAAHPDRPIRVRMMRDPEYMGFVTWGGKYTEEEVKARAHLHRQGVRGTASVTDAAAALRTTEEGFVDVFGNVWIWTDSAAVQLTTGADIDQVARVTRSTSWYDYPALRTRVRDYRGADFPYIHSGYVGVRFVAVPRAS